MLRTRSRIGTGAALTLGVALTFGGGLGVASAADQPSGVDVWVVPETQEAGNGYWTSERMKAAIPADVLVAGKTAKTPTADVERGAELVVPRVRTACGCARPRQPARREGACGREPAG